MCKISASELADTFGGITFKICLCEIAQSSTPSNGVYNNEGIHTESSGPPVVLKCQGQAQGVVHMDSHGKFTLAQAAGDQKGIFCTIICTYAQ